jgi:nucleotide-binding universal stress UspA family protein
MSLDIFLMLKSEPFPEKITMKANKVIVAVSLEPETHGPLMKLRDLDLSADTEIHLVHVVPVILYARGMQLSVLTYPLPEDRPEMEKSIKEKLKVIRQEVLPHHKNVHFKCLFDSNEKSAFNDYVMNQKADLVVVATRGRHGIANFFDSSFAQHQLKHSPVNVLVLR